MTDKKVIIYTTNVCAYCKMAKAFFEEKNVTFEERNVETDEKARDEMINKTGQMGVPVIDIGGEFVVGFDQARMKELLGID